MFAAWIPSGAGLRHSDTHTEGKSLDGEKVRKEFNKKTGLTALTDQV